MFFVGGLSSKLKPAGSAVCVCPACKAQAELHVIHKYMTPHIFFIPTFRFRSEYIATCGNCASVMSLPSDVGRALERDPGKGLAADELYVIKNNFRG